MAEGFEPYHVPQQSRRDKLRVNNHHHTPPPPQPPGCVDNLQACASLLPLYDPSLIPSDFLHCAANVHRHPYTLAAANAAGVKEEGMNLMGFLSGVNHVFADPHLSVPLNPSSIHQDINGGQFAYPSPSGPAHCYRPVGLEHHQPYHQEPISNSGQSLSLSLSSHHNNNNNNMQKYDFSNPIELSKSTVPLGPFTGYASVLKGSRFLRPAHQLLEELCDMGRGIYTEKNGPDPGLLDPPPLDNLTGDGIVDDCGDGGEQTRKKSKLLSMLDEVYKRYKQYYQQMQAAVAAFESVAGLSSAAPFANLALKAMSKHFRCLKNAITDQLQFASKSHGKINYERDETQRLENSGKISSVGYAQRSFHGSGFIDPPVWRPQRGLPEHAVAVLRSWLFEHFLHPYPTDTDKLMLAKQTGLSRNQVSNWFINARVRLWKPMVEEIHMLETRQGQKSTQRDEQSPNAMHDHPPTSSSIECENNASASIQRTADYPSKRTREGPTETPRGNRALIKSPYVHLLPNNNNHHQMHVGVSNPSGGNSGVSLTLGLHQNVGLGLSDSYPINAARRFGLDSHGEEYVVSGFVAAQNRQFGRDIMEGQIMHDFVG
ncbi:bel1-like homeodomain protein 9 [Phtheirospermum japonicum]|uniref:Bel1-like homeodomain protein 9 n=1 Tax=Phtheirospermum japonicum TaxID=374723 RepID=A0A830BR95_9LAMI|nr:bel1-like homeodomain protein 9 [Phtheirospermum japonicum]